MTGHNEQSAEALELRGRPVIPVSFCFTDLLEARLIEAGMIQEIVLREGKKSLTWRPPMVNALLSPDPVTKTPPTGFTTTPAAGSGFAFANTPAQAKPADITNLEFFMSPSVSLSVYPQLGVEDHAHKTEKKGSTERRQLDCPDVRNLFHGKENYNTNVQTAVNMMSDMPGMSRSVPSMLDPGERMLGCSEHDVPCLASSLPGRTST